jgi:hypothetical protein
MQRFKLQNRRESLGPEQLVPQDVTGNFHSERQWKTHISKSELATQAIRSAVGFKNLVKSKWH